VSPTVFKDTAPLVIPHPGTSVSKKQVLTWVRELMKRRWYLAPAGLGVELPLSFCTRRSLRMDSRLLNTAVDDICHELVGNSGTILARPFMGISTLLRLLVVEDIENKNSSECPIYITADDFFPYVLTGRGIKNYLTD